MSWVIIDMATGYQCAGGVIPAQVIGGSNQSQKTTISPSTMKACGIMALSQTTGHGIYFPSLDDNNNTKEDKKQ